MKLQFQTYSGEEYLTEFQSPIERNALDVIVCFKKNTKVCSTKDIRAAHAFMRFNYENGCTSENREFYISLGTLDRLTTRRRLRAHFRRPEEDELNLPWKNSNYNLRVVRIYGTDTGKCYEALEALFPNSLENARPCQGTWQWCPNIDLPLGNGLNSDIARARITSHKFFSATASLFFQPCCAQTTFWSSICCQTPRHNCTSLVVYLLEKSGVTTDISCRNIWIGLLSNVIISGSLAYAARELEEFHRRGPDDSGISQSLAVSIYAASGIFLFLTLGNLFVGSQFSQCLSKFLQIPQLLKLTTIISCVCAVTLSLLAFTLLAARHFKGSALKTAKEIESFDLTTTISSMVLLGSFFVQLVGTSICSFQTNFSAPNALLRILNRVPEKSQTAQVFIQDSYRRLEEGRSYAVGPGPKDRSIIYQNS